MSCSLTIIFSLFSPVVGAQTSGLPRFKKGESYKTVRAKMLKAKWKPFHAADADECYDGDARCANRPEMEHCSGTGLGFCAFLWKRKGKTVKIITAGDNAGYQSYEFR